jgi:anaerobic ribonucleoside-triphosphate reductase
MIELAYQAEELIMLFNEFIASLRKDSFSQKESENKAHQEIEKLLHKMGKPLISQSALQRTVK